MAATLIQSPRKRTCRSSTCRLSYSPNSTNRARHQGCTLLFLCSPPSRRAPSVWGVSGGMLLNRFGGLGATVIRFIRRLGFDDIGIWKMGANTRWAFLLVASTWESLPAAWRRKIPFQIVRLHSVRLHHWRLSENGYKGLSGILSKSSEFLVQSERVRFFPRTSKRRTFLGLMAKPQGRPLPWQEESLLRAEIVVSAGHDSTFPHQWDTRYLQNTETDVHALVKSISRSSIRRWYAENLTSYEPVFSPLPGGVLPSPWRDSVRVVRTRPQVGYTGNRLFCAHRDRGGKGRTRNLMRVAQ